ncbi:hypothetical protein [Catenulispora subtropica]|uniref:Proteinase inhibitor I42 chagasin domain-containing protein n=1 Tax=Catenulispora subtropica TaxID=450798 RepID=A0ABP5C6N7_9ACTN
MTSSLDTVSVDLILDFRDALMSVPEPPEVTTFVHRPGDPWEVSVRAAQGTALRIELYPAGGYRWSGIDSSDPDVLGLDGGVDGEGVARFTGVALHAGQTVLVATTQFQGDRFGPPARRWTMTVQVDAWVSRAELIRSLCQ